VNFLSVLRLVRFYWTSYHVHFVNRFRWFPISAGFLEISHFCVQIVIYAFLCDNPSKIPFVWLEGSVFV